MRSRDRDFASLAVAKYLADLLAKLTGSLGEDRHKAAAGRLNDLTYDLYHVLHGRRSAKVLLYSLVDWRVFRLKSVGDQLVEYLKEPEKAALSSEAHVQIASMLQGQATFPSAAVAAASVGAALRAAESNHRQLGALHAASLM